MFELFLCSVNLGRNLQQGLRNRPVTYIVGSHPHLTIDESNLTSSIDQEIQCRRVRTLTLFLGLPNLERALDVVTENSPLSDKSETVQNVIYFLQKGELQALRIHSSHEVFRLDLEHHGPLRTSLFPTSPSHSPTTRLLGL